VPRHDRLGSRLACVLAGAWRAAPPALSLSADGVAEVVPSLLRTGAAGLTWWRLRGTEAAAFPAARELHEAYRLQTLHAAVREHGVAQAVTLLRGTGVEAVLGKGWAIARHYPDLGLRPYGDVDLYVREAVHPRAAAVANDASVPIDLHRGFAELDDRAESELLERSREVALGPAAVRVFGEEHHLRLLALHLLRHGGYRPLWLCDLAVALETRSTAFDWDLFLRGSVRRKRWAACALLLAHRVLGADLAGVPAAVTQQRLPRWLVRSLLERWGAVSFVPHGMRRPWRASLRAPAAGLRALVQRWPNGIEASVGTGGPFNELPRLPFQIAECVRRAAVFVARRPPFVDFGRGQPQP
jgi:putative nucleotidyltransferase-like protein